MMRLTSRWAVITLVAATVMFSYGVHQADAQIIAYKIHPDIFTELQDRYPEHAEEYWEDVKDAIREGIDEWVSLNPDLIFTPSHDDRYDVIIEWIDSGRAWGVEYHDRSTGNRIGIDFNAPGPDAYGASLLNPDIIQYIMAHEIGHLLGMGHSSEAGHLMYGESNPRPDRVFNNMGYLVPYPIIENFENIGGNKLDIVFHLQGYHVYDIETMDINGTQYVVVSTGTDGIYMVDMSDPRSPRLAGSYDMPSYNTTSLDGWPYLVVLYSGGIDVLDVSDPNNIILSDSVVHPQYMHDAILVEVDGKMVVVTVSRGIIQQYNLADPYDIRRTGAYADDFSLLGVRAIQSVTHNNNTYALVDATYDGTMVFTISGDRNPALVQHHTAHLEYDGTIRTVVTVGDDEYRISYWREQILVHEITSLYSSDPIGRLLGYEALEIDDMKVDGGVYVVIAAGADGVFGIHIGDEATGKWTFG